MPVAMTFKWPGVPVLSQETTVSIQNGDLARIVRVMMAGYYDPVVDDRKLTDHERWGESFAVSNYGLSWFEPRALLTLLIQAYEGNGIGDHFRGNRDE